MKEMTQAEYAKHRGVTKVAVTKWKRKGLLVLAKSGKISVNRSDKKLDAMKRPESEKSHGLLMLVDKHDKTSQEYENDEMEESIESGEGNIPKLPEKLKALLGDQMMTKFEAETMKENYLAKLRKLEYEKKAGSVVEVEPLRKLLFELWRRERDALLNFPTRYSAVIAAKLGVDQNALTIELELCINEFLNERSEQPRITIGKSM